MIRVFRQDLDPNLSKYPDPTGSGSVTLVKMIIYIIQQTFRATNRPRRQTVPNLFLSSTPLQYPFYIKIIHIKIEEHLCLTPLLNCVADQPFLKYQNFLLVRKIVFISKSFHLKNRRCLCITMYYALN